MSRLALLLLNVVPFLSACGDAYVVRGKVVRGEFGFIEFVEADDPRLAQPGVASAEVLIHRDADRPNARVVARGRADSGGQMPKKPIVMSGGFRVADGKIMLNDNTKQEN